MLIATMIQQWFNTQGSFVDGVHLLRQAGADRGLVASLERHCQGPYLAPAAQAELKHHLQLFLDAHPVEAVEIVEIVEAIPTPLANQTKATPTSSPLGSNLSEPLPIRQLRAQAIPLHREHSHVKTLLSVAATDEERYKLAQRIMEQIIPALDNIYDQIRHFEKTGEIPTPKLPKSEKQKLLEAFKRMRTLSPRISKLKSLLKRKDLDGVKRKKYEKELLDKELELAQINKLLNDDDGEV